MRGKEQNVFQLFPLCDRELPDEAQRWPASQAVLNGNLVFSPSLEIPTNANGQKEF